MKNKRLRIRTIVIIFIILIIFTSSKVYLRAASDSAAVSAKYQDYQQRFEGIEEKEDIAEAGFQVIEGQIFPITLETFGDVFFVPAFETQYLRLALFLIDENGQVVYKTDQLESNNRNKGQLKQLNRSIAAVSFQDMDGDGLTDIALITTCVNITGDHAGKPYKVGDVLFQNQGGFYRDYRISDKINRFSMNKSIKTMAAFIRDGYSTEFLYTAATLDELLENGLEIVVEQNYTRQFEKLGRLQVVPGIYRMANYDVFMIYLVNDQGDIVWSLQPMGEYDSLYALRGISCKDIDGDGLKDMVVLARYSKEGSYGEALIENDYAIYYQRTGGFYADTEYKRIYRCDEEVTMEELVRRARAYWGWKVEE